MNFQAAKVLCVCALISALIDPIQAQTVVSYRARLSRAAIDTAELAKVAGLGSVTAELDGSTLTIKGTFAGLLSAATKAHLDRGLAKGLRGRPLFDLTVSPSTAGEISGRVTLTASQMDDLRQGRLYVQIDSQQAPDGNLWGWILPQETRR